MSKKLAELMWTILKANLIEREIIYLIIKYKIKEEDLEGLINELNKIKVYIK